MKSGAAGRLFINEHIHDKINKAYMMLGLIKRNLNTSQVKVSHCCIII